MASFALNSTLPVFGSKIIVIGALNCLPVSTSKEDGSVGEPFAGFTRHRGRDSNPTPGNL